MNTDPVSVPQHSLTVIVPAYNEADRLQLTLEQLVAASWLREKQGGVSSSTMAPQIALPHLIPNSFSWHSGRG
jgi:hypothetical protein